MSAILYDSADSAGGAPIPVVVDQTVVPLAPVDSSVRRLANVIPTTSDVTIPFETSAGAPAIKPQSGPALSPFVNTSGTIGGTRLRAWMIGAEQDFSYELFTDAPLFANFVVGSMSRAQQAVEEALYIAGSGVGEPQGILGNVGTGVTEEPDSAGNLVTAAGLLNLVGTLKAAYFPNATFLMNRVTATNLRKSQLGVPGEPLFSRENGKDYLLGFPVEYSAAMPLATRGATPVVFGDVFASYLIGDRDGSNLKVKVLDQDPAKVLAGVVSTLTYRRGDGRVRQPEALQQYNVAAA